MHVRVEFEAESEADHATLKAFATAHGDPISETAAIEGNVTFVRVMLDKIAQHQKDEHFSLGGKQGTWSAFGGDLGRGTGVAR